MTIQEFRDYMASGKPVVGGGDVHIMFHQLSQEALKITAEINGKYHTPEQLHNLLEQLWGREVSKTVGMFPPFHTDCGKNTIVGERVFINMGCKFQDQGGITIDEGWQPSIMTLTQPSVRVCRMPPSTSERTSGLEPMQRYLQV